MRNPLSLVSLSLLSLPNHLIFHAHTHTHTHIQSYSQIYLCQHKLQPWLWCAVREWGAVGVLAAMCCGTSTPARFDRCVRAHVFVWTHLAFSNRFDLSKQAASQITVEWAREKPGQRVCEAMRQRQTLTQAKPWSHEQEADIFPDLLYSFFWSLIRQL